MCLTLRRGSCSFRRICWKNLASALTTKSLLIQRMGSLVIRPTDEETGSAEPIFRTDEPAPLKLDALLKEIGPEYITEAYSDAGLVTRDEFMAMLQEYEEQFSMSSAEFYEKWQNGELPEKVELFFWAHRYEDFLREGGGK